MNFTREGKETTYIHYGASAFDKTRFVQVVNRIKWIKPVAHTGLWGSPVDAKWGWKDWCEAENFRECDESNSFKFTVKNPEKIFFVNSKESYKELIKLYGDKNNLTVTFDYTPWYINFNKMINDGWEGLEISITDYPTLYDLLYGWDCDSILIFTKDAIVPVTTEDKEETIYDEFETTLKRDPLGPGVFGEWEKALLNNQFS